MKINKKIRQKILNDNQFSLKCAMAINITQAAIKEQARRNSEKLALHSLVDFFKSEGFTEDEIFEKEKMNK